MTAAALEAIIAKSDQLDGATVAWVETDLAVHLNRLAKAVTEATAARNAAIVTASAAGHSLREIAMATGMAYATVGRIINAEKAGES
jgi:predicted transcriptional regulator